MTDDRSEIVVEDGAPLGAVWLSRLEGAALVADTGAVVLAPAWELGCAPEVDKRVLGLLNSGIDDGFAGLPLDIAEVGAEVGETVVAGPLVFGADDRGIVAFWNSAELGAPKLEV